jgi:molybdate transport system permease protein
MNIFHDPTLAFPILLTLKTCMAALLLFLLVGPPLALWVSRSDSFVCRCVSFVITLPLVFPPIALGYMLLVLLGRMGPFGGVFETLGIKIVFTQTGVCLAAFVAGLPLVVRPLQAVLGGEDILKLEQAARVTGCGPFRTFVFVTVPLARDTLVSGLLLAAARASGEVGVTMMLGGNIAGRTNTLSLEIFNCVSRGDFDQAGQLCMLLAAVGLLLYLALEKLQRKKES